MQAAHRVAKNTLILYARMAITVFISLYSTRLILAALGVSDFGLFNVVGGVISMLGFLNASMAAATQRFISFAQGEGDLEKVKRIFNMSSLLHWGIAILVFFVLEVAGYFFFNGILNIAPDRVGVAKIIYQFMIVSTLFTVISVPYEAVITSHENMMVYAMLGIVEALLKLGIAIYITHAAFDHLMIYGCLMALLAILLLVIRRIYCHRVYKECVLNIKVFFDKPLLKEISGYAGWSLLGTSSSILVNYGQGVILNVFFGTIVNAAQGISAQISGQLNVFATTLIKALNPTIDKSEGAGNRSAMLNATMIGSKISFFLIMVFYIFFLIELPYIFKLWLKNIPQYAVVFCRLLLIRNLIEQLFIPLASAISAQGNIKDYQIRASILLFFPLIISYLLFKYEYPPYALYIIFIIYSILASCIILYYTKKNCELSIKDFLFKVILRCVACFCIVFSLAFLPHMIMQESLMRLIFVGFVTFIFFIVFVFLIGFSKNEKQEIKELVKFFINKASKNKFKKLVFSNYTSIQ